LLLSGTTLWNVADWSEAGLFKYDGSAAAILPSADDKLLYVMGGDDAAVHFRIDWRTGTREEICTEQKMPISSVNLTADGRRMLTVSVSDDSARLWELPADHGALLGGWQAALGRKRQHRVRVGRGNG